MYEEWTAPGGGSAGGRVLCSSCAFFRFSCTSSWSISDWICALNSLLARLNDQQGEDEDESGVAETHVPIITEQLAGSNAPVS